MKKIKLIALFLVISLIFCCCTKDPSDDDKTPSTPPGDQTNTITPNPNQSKLDALTPDAYGNMSGLNFSEINFEELGFEPGSCISIIGRYSDDSYWKQVEAGAKRAIEDLNTLLGYTGEDKIRLSFCAPDIRDDVDEQISILDEELARYPIALCISAVDASACGVQFDLAAENSIPVITFDSGSEYQNITAHISTNNKKAAESAAENLAALIEGNGEVAVFVQDSFSMTAKDREEAFINKLKTDFPEISVVNVYHLDELENIAKQIIAENTPEDSSSESAAVQTPESSEKTDESNDIETASNEISLDPSDFTQKDIVQYIFKKNPNLEGIYTTNLDTTQLVADVVSSLELKNLHIVGFDGGEEQLELLENDIIDGLIVQNPYGMGYATVVAAIRTVFDLGNEAVIDSGYTWVTKTNMVETEISKMLY